jgi:hypothetical protein
MLVPGQQSDAPASFDPTLYRPTKELHTILSGCSKSSVPPPHHFLSPQSPFPPHAQCCIRSSPAEQEPRLVTTSLKYHNSGIFFAVHTAHRNCLKPLVSPHTIPITSLSSAWFRFNGSRTDSISSNLLNSATHRLTDLNPPRRHFGFLCTSLPQSRTYQLCLLFPHPADSHLLHPGPTPGYS